MTDSQFAYSNLTLDELRSLAASPQVGTMHAMPQSFRALADKVGEVADLLTHAQVNMHSWWKGPAAEQAAATLGRAAAEAQKFHDTAMGAATAVGHCAQIVSEQQHQIMNVPEVAEPGVSDVVPQPTTPFEALEAMRRDAAYQAAHEQAVQVVNGIAAQYVETRSQLSNMGFTFGENFTVKEDPTASTTKTAIPHASDSHSTARESSNISQFDKMAFTSAAVESSGEKHLTYRGSAGHKEGSLPPSRPKSPAKSTSMLTAIPSGDKGRAVNKNPPVEPISFEKTTSNVEPGPAMGPGSVSDPLSIEKQQRPESSDGEYGLEYAPSYYSRYAVWPTEDRPVSETYDATRTGYAKADHALLDERHDINSSQANRLSAAVGDEALHPSPFPFQQPQRGGLGNDNAAMIPPYSGVGPVHRSREERNRRPAYLKERESVWLPETIAAPPDGILTLEWLEQR